MRVSDSGKKLDARRSARLHALHRAGLSRIACAAALTLLSPSRGQAADDMSEAEAIKEIERLGGKVYESAPPPDPTRPAARAPFFVARVTGPRLGEQVRLLKRLSALDIVRIAAARIDDDSLEYLRFCARLRSLGVVGSERVEITDGALEQIARVKSLKDLDLGMAAVPESGFAHIRKLENLERLRVRGGGITDAAVSSLAVLTKLRYLTLLNTAVTNAGIGELRTLTNLQQLSIHSNDIGDGAIGKLKGLHLRELSIGDAITDAGLNDLAHFNTLRVLDLARLPITDAGLKSIPQMTAQSVLNLDGTMISDRGLNELERLTTLHVGGRNVLAPPRRLQTVPGLTELHLEETGITDAGLSRLMTFENVPTLFLRGTKVSPEGMDELQRRTHARIRSWPGATGTPGAGASSGNKGRIPGAKK